jgi:anti-sigma factor ChrR (cupin superfamily)
MPAACSEVGLIYDFAIGTLSGAQARTFSAHLATCAACSRELDRLRTALTGLAGWPSDVLARADSRGAQLIEQSGRSQGESDARRSFARRTAWSDVAPGIACRLLAVDPATGRTSMLVRLAPGVDYPAHRHAGVEELHLLHGELIIDDRTLQAGEYYSAAPGTVDSRVWSRTGCMCVLITSLNDELIEPAAGH